MGARQHVIPSTPAVQPDLHLIFWNIMHTHLQTYADSTAGLYGYLLSEQVGEAYLTAWIYTRPGGHLLDSLP